MFQKVTTVGRKYFHSLSNDSKTLSFQSQKEKFFNTFFCTITGIYYWVTIFYMHIVGRSVVPEVFSAE